MGKAGKISGAVSLIFGFLFLIGWFGVGIGVDYIDNQLEENCNSTSGQIGQITGWDEGQCQDGKRYMGPSFFITIFIATWWSGTMYRGCLDVN